MGTTTQDPTRLGFAGSRSESNGSRRENGAMSREERLARGLGWFSIGLGMAELLAPGAVSRIAGTRNHKSLVRAYGLRELAAGVGILTSSEPGPWIWSRVAGDLVDLASLGSVLGGRGNSRGKAVFSIASVAGVTVLDVMCAQKLATNGGNGHACRAEANLIVNVSPQQCYEFWRNFENLPKFMDYLQSVRTTEGNRSHWVAEVGGQTFEWDAEIESDVPNERITWHSLPGSDVVNSGAVEFERAPGGRGTIVRVQMDYGNMMQALASAVATVAGKHPEQMIRKELVRFKQVMEVGEVITTEGQSSGRRSGGVTWMDRIAR
jgi:uncharacterized membrane protein